MGNQEISTLLVRTGVYCSDKPSTSTVSKEKYINDRVMRWSLYLQGFRIRIETIKGRDNNAADFPSLSLYDGALVPKVSTWTGVVSRVSKQLFLGLPYLKKSAEFVLTKIEWPNTGCR